jgi:hypothetical protein
MPESTIQQATLQRVTTIDTKGGGYAILLTTTNNVADDVLLKLLRSRGSVFKVTFEDVQLALQAGDDPNEGVQPTPERVWETASGDVVKGHPFESTSGDGLCDLCGHPESHEAHQQPLSELAEKLLENLATEEDTKFPKEQAEAREALASRSRSGRNGR